MSGHLELASATAAGRSSTGQPAGRHGPGLLQHSRRRSRQRRCPERPRPPRDQPPSGIGPSVRTGWLSGHTSGLAGGGRFRAGLSGRAGRMPGAAQRCQSCSPRCASSGRGHMAFTRSRQRLSATSPPGRECGCRTQGGRHRGWGRLDSAGSGRQRRYRKDIECTSEIGPGNGAPRRITGDDPPAGNSVSVSGACRRSR